MIASYTFTRKDDGVHIQVTSLCDPGGMIPKWIINTFSARAPVEWLGKLQTHALKVQKDPAKCKERDVYVKEQLDRVKDSPMKL